MVPREKEGGVTQQTDGRRSIAHAKRIETSSSETPWGEGGSRSEHVILPSTAPRLCLRQ